MVGAFETQCSLPPGPVNFVSAPNVRGTFDIVWSCLIILLLCTWSVQHLNIPPQLVPMNNIQRIRHFMALTMRRASGMLFTLVAPEWTFGLAFAEFVSARYNRKCMKGWADEDGVDWSLAHSFFANMGGTIICFPPELDGDNGTDIAKRTNSGGHRLSPAVTVDIPQIMRTYNLTCHDWHRSLEQYSRSEGYQPISRPATSNMDISSERLESIALKIIRPATAPAALQ